MAIRPSNSSQGAHRAYPLPLSLNTPYLAARASIAVRRNETDFPGAVSAHGLGTFDDLSPGPYDDTLYRTTGTRGYHAGSASGLQGVGGRRDISLSNTTCFHPIVGVVSSGPLSSAMPCTDGGGHPPSATNIVLTVPEQATYGLPPAVVALPGMTARRRRG